MSASAVMAAIAPPSDADVAIKVEDKPTLTPPPSEGTDKHYDSGSDLSDLEPEPEENLDDRLFDDDEEIEPDHYYERGKIPVFKPTMDQFRSFKKFISKIDKYGMKSGIVKVIPPKEWRDKLPDLDEAVKTVKVKNPITQEFHGTHGTYTQANIEKQRSYNLPQWKALTEESNHQPPAKRGERRKNQEVSTRTTSTRSSRPSTVPEPSKKKRGVGRPRVRPVSGTLHKREDTEEELASNIQVPPTPTSPPLRATKVKKERTSDDEGVAPSKSKGRQPKSVASRRQHNRRDQGDIIDEEAFKNFDYRVYNQSEWTPERCSELETAYWKGLTFNNPMYGADMPGSLFNDSTREWNVANLENLLDVLGQSVPGVNTAYLYLGMWKASFAWHLEDVDLYSINYIHFGAPKQWYSISQEDARRFEAAMRSVWPNDAKNCDQFLRHKTYLISPQLLQSQYNIRVNRLVHHEGEFVITFPYGYHSGYNLGYNCAESVNFATESWLDYGKVARKCNCEADSVWVDVFDIERKLRGEPTPEYYEETDDEDDEEDDEDGPTDLPTPPGSDKGKSKARSYKRKRDAGDKDAKPKKKLRIRLKAPAYEPCILCPNDYHFEELLPTDNGLKAHRSCGLYTPETYISDEDGIEKICGIARIDKARLELKCNFCRSKKGAVFQCSQLKCTRAYHATCAIAAGVQIDSGEVPVYADDGTEYKDNAIDFRCKIHRSKRFKNMDTFALEDDEWIRKHALKLQAGSLVQIQYYQGDIFGGAVVENRKSEQALLIEVLPSCEILEVEYKWLLVFDPANSHLPAPSPNAKPLPKDLAQLSRDAAEDTSSDIPKAGQPFCDPNSIHVWSEINMSRAIKNPAQAKVDLSKTKQLWFYLGRTSTEAKAQYTGNLTKPVNDPDANFLDSVRPPPPPFITAPLQRRSYPVSYPSGLNLHAASAVGLAKQYSHKPQQKQQTPKERPYHGKYAINDPVPYQYKPRETYHADHYSPLTPRAPLPNVSQQPRLQYNNVPIYQAPPAPMGSVAPMASMTPATLKPPSQNQIKPPEFKKPPTQISAPKPSPAASVTKSKAPTANMMGDPGVSSIPFSGPSSSSCRAPAFELTTKPSDRKGVSTLPVPQHWHYLHQAERDRPKAYQSPYAEDGGFTEAYKPKSQDFLGQKPKRYSLSEDFLLKQTPVNQDKLKAHIKRNNDDRIQKQQEKIRQGQEKLHLIAQQQEQQRQQQEQELRQQRQALSLTVPSPSPTSYHASNPLQNHHHSPFQSFNDYSTNYSRYSDPYAPNPHAHSPTTYHGSYAQAPPQQQDVQSQRVHNPWSNASPPGSAGLQYQSPQDFKMQMQREAQQQSERNDFNKFIRGLQFAAGQGPPGMSNHAPGGSGSPLKYETASAEMLPIMRDPRY